MLQGLTSKGHIEVITVRMAASIVVRHMHAVGFVCLSLLLSYMGLLLDIKNKACADCWHCLCRFPNGESGADVYDRMTIFEDHLIRDINAGELSGGHSLYVLGVALQGGTRL